jgi:hypothetical protein
LDKDALVITAEIQCVVNLRQDFDLNALEKFPIHLTQEEQEQRQKWATQIEMLHDRLDTLENYRDCAWEDVWAPLWSQQVEQDIRAEHQDRHDAGLVRKAKVAKDKATRKEAAEKDREYWASRSTGARGRIRPDAMNKNSVISPCLSTD